MAGKSPPQSIDDLNNEQVATLAIYALGGSGSRQDSEDIAIRCHELAPAKFGWKKHRELPSLAVANEALSDARRTSPDGVRVQANTGLISGKPKEGWILTPDGAAWCEANEHLLPSDAGDAQKARPEEVRLLRNIRDHPQFARWLGGGEPPAPAQVAGALLIASSAPAEAVENRIRKLRTITSTADDGEIERYLEWLQTTGTAGH